MIKIERCWVSNCKGAAVATYGYVPMDVRDLWVNDCPAVYKNYGPSHSFTSHKESLNPASPGWTAKYGANYRRIDWDRGCTMKFTNVTTKRVDHFYVGPEGAPLEVNTLHMEDGKSVVQITSKAVEINNGASSIRVTLPADFKQEELEKIISVILEAKSKGADPTEAVANDPIWKRWLSAGGDTASILQLIPLVMQLPWLR